MAASESYIVVAKIGAPHGVRGDLKLNVFCECSDAVLAFEHFFVQTKAGWELLQDYTIKPRANGFLIRFAHCTDRDLARQYVNQELAVPRTALPELPEGEYYQSDLMGFAVYNSADEYFGDVSYFLETGANDVLVTKGQQEYLIPYVADVIVSIDSAERRIMVDWSKDYL